MTNPALVQYMYNQILRHFIRTGRAPHFTELAAALGTTPDEARELQREVVETAPIAGSWMCPDTDYIESFAPFSNVPTHHLINVDGEPGWYGQ